MKKFMKAIAFVTVMCMALSTVAFAADEGTAVQDTTDYKQINVTVTGAAKDEQVALLILPKNAGTSSTTIHYIYQKAAVETANGAEAYFEAPLTVDNGTEVDVYVGYSSNSGDAIKIGTVTITAPITEVTVTKESAVTLDTNNGVGATFTVTAPADVQATHIIWAINIGTEAAPVYKYTDSFDITEYYIGTVIENGSNVTLGLVFENADNTAISGVEAIFMFDNGEDAATKDLSGDKATNNQSGGNE